MSGMQVPTNSVWSSMNYTPPRGSCNHKNGMISNKCPCLRFMLHPVKAATSFECDGCGHHASYHNLDNPSEDAILAKWSAQEAQTQAATTTTSARNNKRRRITSQPHNEQQAAITIADDSETVDGAPNGQTRNNEKLHAFSSVFSSRSGSQR
ncbi:unnamed protein product [Aureobasidium pullulans]|uniref:Uncharacterized protein n=1 Tax=Aureobasidium pullulans TaxID=5580 RepID=A0A4S8S3U1_AURPU|nr:hypothetical protein D6D28_09648 [Aureobasidium pullulans]THW11348.1 hypothetical protein D6D24_07270 [Aureobasidium pullulans]THW41060.1 hypothetical protein D6D22_05559 [Aureobasidium pullulans]THW61502.1 hypothetical protein D6D20_05013 [Aureobasidium pullulans]CAC9886877.1 unnamed protein product [Aureobasidium pullulans]